MATRESILAILKGVPEPRVNQVGPYWQIGFAWLSGADENGDRLARHLLARWKNEKVHVADPVSPPPSNPELDYKAMYEELKRQAEAPPAEVPIPFFLSMPPNEVSDVLAEIGADHTDSYERVNSALVAALTKAKGSAELARSYGGSFDGKSVVEWERKAQAINESIRWNAGRKVETI